MYAIIGSFLQPSVVLYHPLALIGSVLFCLLNNCCINKSLIWFNKLYWIELNWMDTWRSQGYPGYRAPYPSLGGSMWIRGDRLLTSWIGNYIYFIHWQLWCRHSSYSWLQMHIIWYNVIKCPFMANNGPNREIDPPGTGPLCHAGLFTQSECQWDIPELLFNALCFSTLFHIWSYHRCQRVTHILISVVHIFHTN